MLRITSWERRCIVAVTLDMVYRRWGADAHRNLMIRSLDIFEQLELGGYRIAIILIVNRDALPKDLHFWLVTLSDQVILTEGVLKEGALVESQLPRTTSLILSQR
ncbi:hypothetical protein DRN63_05335 [Nanoarchaeota archaeon]|nr:MAG: hypothetical protein DRN63_05335 [Nanoarchaeota archaeon]